jgi:hypothetical protein
MNDLEKGIIDYAIKTSSGSEIVPVFLAGYYCGINSIKDKLKNIELISDECEISDYIFHIKNLLQCYQT